MTVIRNQIKSSGKGKLQNLKKHSKFVLNITFPSQIKEDCPFNHKYKAQAFPKGNPRLKKAQYTIQVQKALNIIFSPFFEINAFQWPFHSFNRSLQSFL